MLIAVTPLVTVYAIKGEWARLACNISAPEDDVVVIVLWYRNRTKAPFHRYIYCSTAFLKIINANKLEVCCVLSIYCSNAFLTKIIANK